MLSFGRLGLQELFWVIFFCERAQSVLHSSNRWRNGGVWRVPEVYMRMEEAGRVTLGSMINLYV